MHGFISTINDLIDKVKIAFREGFMTKPRNHIYKNRPNSIPIVDLIFAILIGELVSFQNVEKIDRTQVFFSIVYLIFREGIFQNINTPILCL